MFHVRDRGIGMETLTIHVGCKILELLRRMCKVKGGD